MATARKRGNKWRCRVWDKISNTYKSFTADTKDEAELAAKNYLKFRVEPVKSRLSIEQACQEYIDSRRNILSPASIERYQRILDKQIGKDFKDILLDKLSVFHVREEVNRLCSKYQPKTVKTTVHFFLPILKKYRRDLDLDDIPLPKVYPKRKDYPTPEKIIEIWRGDPMELEVLLALSYGMRKEEIRGLRFTDLAEDVITIRRTIIDVKGAPIVRENAAKTVNSIRSIQLSPYVCKLIASRTGEYITNLSGHAIYMRFTRKMTAAGYPGITFHDLRHINASVMVFLGVPDKYAMERGGWSTDSTLKKVYQSTFSDQRKRYDAVVDDYFSKLYDQKV